MLPENGLISKNDLGYTSTTPIQASEAVPTVQPEPNPISQENEQNQVLAEIKTMEKKWVTKNWKID